jgi:hypothetical protein
MSTAPRQLTIRLPRGRRLASLVVTIAVAAGLVTSLMPRSTASTVMYPIRVADGHRNLVGQNGAGFFLDVDTAWTWLSNVPDRAEADAYLDARKAQGFNTVMSFMAGFRSKNFTKGGTPAFIGGDIGKPNDAYFQTVDALVTDAAARGMQVMMGPLNLSDNLFSSPDGCPTRAQWAAYGSYVGKRYRSFDNIIWFLGGDHDAHSTWGDTVDYTPYLDAMATAIKAADPRHLMTYHPSSDTFELSGRSWLDFYAFQENRADSAPFSYQRVKPYYDHTPIKPVIDLEPGYETGDALTNVATTPYMVRRNAWWAFLQGGLGVTYGGNRATWYLGSTAASGWKPYVGLGGAKQTGLMPSIVNGFRWTDLVPDSGHTLVTAGYGTFGGKDYVTAGRSPDGAQAVIYVPTSRTLTLAMSRFASSVQGTWYDPSTGATQALSGGVLANSGSHSIATPGANAAGDQDWLLVLSPAGSATPTSTTSSSTTTTTSSTTTTTSTTRTTTTTTTTTTPAGTGLTGRYYSSRSLAGPPVLTRVDPTINFGWGTGAPAAGLPTDNFSVRWTGKLVAPGTGRYTLSFRGDDGFRVYVDGSDVIDAWSDHSSPYTRTSSLALTGGKAVALVVEYYDRRNSASAQLSWSGPGIASQVVPARYLYPA